MGSRAETDAHIDESGTAEREVTKRDCVMSSMLNAHIVIDPSLVTPERLRELLAMCRDFLPVLQDIGDILEEQLAENFFTRGFGTWAPLAAATQKERYRLGFSGRPDLIRTGALFEALTERGAPGHKFLVSAHGISVGVYGDVIPYEYWLAYGTRRMPARLLVQIGTDGQQRIIQMIKQWLGADAGVEVTMDDPVLASSWTPDLDEPPAWFPQSPSQTGVQYV